VVLLFLVPGWAGPDSLKETMPADGKVKIRTTRTQDEAMCEAIKARKENPGSYNLYSRQCTEFVEGVLEAGGVKNLPHSAKPKVLFWNLLTR
jgi:hypothetical protein